MDESKALEYFREDSCDITFWLKDKKTKEYLDLTGYVFTMALSSVEDPDDPDVAPIQFTITGVLGDQLTEKGKVSFAPTSSDTAIPEGEYYYDVSYIANGKKKTIIKNKIWIETPIYQEST